MKVFQIMEKKNLWFLISTIVILIGVGLMVSRSLTRQPVLNFGIDFKGGSTMMLSFENLNQQLAEAKANGNSKDSVVVNFLGELRGILKSKGLEESTIQVTQDKEVLIKTIEMSPQENLALRHEFESKLGALEVLEIDFIGPTIGAELREKSLMILAVASMLLLLYITWRFQFSYGLAALIALLHDALVTLSLAAIFSIEINTIFVAAFLTVLGYSINDTIVLFDRIRENDETHGETQPLPWIANVSIAQTLVRTLNTSLTTLVVVLSLLLFGGTTLSTFCTVLLIGIVAGTYSSIFIASPTLVALKSSD